MVIQKSLLTQEFQKNVLRFKQNAKKGPKKCPCLFKTTLDWRKFSEI